MRTLGPERVVLVMNTAFGDPSLLPFDLRMRRVIKYALPETTQDKVEIRRSLEAEFERTLRGIFETPFDYLEGTWDHLSSDKIRFEDGRATEITYIALGAKMII